MSAQTEQIVDRLADQLTGFEDQLRANETGTAALAKIRESIGVLLDIDTDNEQTVRRVLREQYEQRRLRKNTYRVAVSIVDQIVSDRVAAPIPAPAVLPHAGTAHDDRTSDTGAAAVSAGVDLASTMILPRAPKRADRPGSRAQAGTVLNNRYQLKETVSTSADGTLFLAYDRTVESLHTDDSRIAVRVLPPKIARDAVIRRALEKEATKAVRLAHPHLVHFVELGEENATCFLVTEWADGRTLADILDSPDARRIDRLSAFRLVRELALALEYMHRCGVVYGDVKPENVMIAADGSARLVDTVTARMRQRRSAPNAGGSTAAPTYASPQALSGDRLEPADDVFSLGCLLYRLIAGYRVFGPRNAADAAAVSMEPQRPQGFSDVQWDAVSRALRFAREERFESVDHFIGGLDAVDDLRATIRRMRAPERRSRSLSGAWLAGAFVLAGAAAVVAFYFGWLPGSLSPGDVRPAGRNITDAVAGSPAEGQDADAAAARGGRVAGAAAARIANDRVAAVDDVLERQREEFEALTGAPRYGGPSTAGPGSAAFEPRLPVNAVGFAEDRIVIAESEAAVSIDVTRFNPDGRAITLQYFVNDISATEGQDYFAPRRYSLEFGPGQDSARILIPLVQDSAPENDESFVIRLMENPTAPAVVERQSIVVTIQDDGPHDR